MYLQARKHAEAKKEKRWIEQSWIPMARSTCHVLSPAGAKKQSRTTNVKTLHTVQCLVCMPHLVPSSLACKSVVLYQSHPGHKSSSCIITPPNCHLSRLKSIVPRLLPFLFIILSHHIDLLPNLSPYWRWRRAIVDDLPLNDSFLIPSLRRKCEPRPFGCGVVLALPFEFADALAAPAAEVLGDFDEAQDVFLSRIKWLVSCLGGWRKKKEGRAGDRWNQKTYISQILHYVEEEFGLLVIIPQPFNRLFDD